MKPNEVLELAEARRLLLSGEARAVRVAAGVSGSELARSIGVTPGAVSRWETGKRRPTGPAASAYAALLTSLRKVRTEGGR